MCVPAQRRTGSTTGYTLTHAVTESIPCPPPSHSHVVQRGLVADPGAAADPQALRKTVQESCALTERDESFEYTYGGSVDKGEEVVIVCVCVSVGFA